MKLHRDLGVTQKTAWFMLHRIREAGSDVPAEAFAGPVEADETFVGGQGEEHAPSAACRCDQGSGSGREGSGGRGAGPCIEPCSGAAGG